MAIPWQLRNSKRRCSPHSEPRPTIELMRSININELRRVIPRYSNRSGGCKPRYGRLRDIERSRYISLRIAVSKALDGFLPLVRC